MTKKDIDFLNDVVTYYRERKMLTEEQFNSLKLLEKGLNKALTLGGVSNRRETLLDYEEWINDYKTLEERENQVDKYLNK